ncbi:MAG: radical SAM protein [Parabacteroides sp.]
MKQSNYNIYVEEEKCVICYNTVFDNFMILSKIDYQRFMQDVDLLKIESEKVYDALVKNGFIIVDGENEFDQLVTEYDKAVCQSSQYELTILPTLDCNLRCWYCYEKHQAGSRFLPGVPESIIEHIKYVFLKNANLESLSVSLFGGEPLLYFREELYPLLSRIKELMSNMKKRVSFFFVTNAVCISEDWLPMFSSLNASFQISIDGSRERHDRVKFIPDARTGTFDQVLGTVRKLTECIEDVYITLRINYDDETLPHLLDILPEIESIDRRKIGIHLERVWQTAQNVENYNNRLLQKVIEEFIHHGFKVTYINFHRRTLSCKSSSYDQIIISYDGRVYKCTGRDFTEDFSDGHLESDGTVNWKKAQVENRMKICTFAHVRCKQCKFLPQCWGPCNQKQLEGKDVDLSCPLSSMEMELDDYIRYRLKNYHMHTRILQLSK